MDNGKWRSICFFFFQAEDGIRDYKVTGVQTCALPICRSRDLRRQRGSAAPERGRGSRSRSAREDLARVSRADGFLRDILTRGRKTLEIGRASCRERV